MNNENTLRLVKVLHTAIWLVMAPASLYILYAGITNTFNKWLWGSIALLVGESVVLVANKWTCPLTPIAMKYTSDRSENFDIYLPRVVAKYNKIIFGTVLVVGLILVVYNAMIRSY